jgi:hypothetical protein
MKTVTRTLAFCGLLGLTFGAPLFAAGPIDGEVSAVWWANDFETKSQTATTSEDAGAPGLRAELWMLERYGVRACQYGSDPSGSDGADYTSVDVMWRAFSPTENNFVALGLGWQQMDIDGLADETSGMRVALEGRVGLMDMLYAYGHGSYLPSLDDVDAVDPTFGRYRDLDAYEYELGVAWNAAPFVNVHAGYRVNNVSFTQNAAQLASIGGSVRPGPQDFGGGLVDIAVGDSDGCTECSASAVAGANSGETESSGFFLGAGFQF